IREEQALIDSARFLTLSVQPLFDHWQQAGSPGASLDTKIVTRESAGQYRTDRFIRWQLIENIQGLIICYCALTLSPYLQNLLCKLCLCAGISTAIMHDAPIFGSAGNLLCHGHRNPGGIR